MKSISDDDLCSSCDRCSYNPGNLSMCALGFPASVDGDGYVIKCPDYSEAAAVTSQPLKCDLRAALEVIASGNADPDDMVKLAQAALAANPEG